MSTEGLRERVAREQADHCCKDTSAHLTEADRILSTVADAVREKITEKGVHYWDGPRSLADWIESGGGS